MIEIVLEFLEGYFVEFVEFDVVFVCGGVCEVELYVVGVEVDFFVVFELGIDGVNVVFFKLEGDCYGLWI